LFSFSSVSLSKLMKESRNLGQVEAFFILIDRYIWL
jgi:hypothetical protein